MTNTRSTGLRSTSLIFSGVLAALLGCEPAPKPQTADSGSPTNQIGSQQPKQESESDKLQKADISILFIGNSHTYFYDMPTLVAQMIEHHHPEKKVYAKLLRVEFLEQVGNNPYYRKELESHPWNFVVLQAQKISMSGKYDYSKQEGIDFAKLAKSCGATVCFYSEWGREGVEGDGQTIEKIYDAMAQAAEVTLAPVGRAWDIALAEQPDLPLYSGDGNHQSTTGAFLTAAVFCGQLTGESPASLASFEHESLDLSTREFLAKAAAKALAPKAVGSNQP